VICLRPGPKRGRKRTAEKDDPTPAVGGDVHSAEDVDTRSEGIPDELPWYLPDLDIPIWEFIHKHNRKPVEKTLKKNADEEDKKERQLAIQIRKRSAELHSETVAKLKQFDDPTEYLQTARHDLSRMPSNAPPELWRKLKLMAGKPSLSALLKERRTDDEAASERTRTEWWSKSGILVRVRVPEVLTDGKETFFRTPTSVMQYDLMHALHLEVEAFLSGETHPACTQKRLYLDFYNGCRSPERRRREPFPENLRTQCGSRRFVPGQCLRQLALLELTDRRYEALPIDDDLLVTEVKIHRARETHQCEVLSELIEAAVQRLLEYALDKARGGANARFLQLKVDAVPVEEKLRRMMRDIVEAFEKQSIDVTVFKPNHLATLSAYYALFLRKDGARPQNGLARWCFGLRRYVAGSEIEPAEGRHEHLASRCLPKHYDASGAAQPAGTNRSGQAIATAPVTCELCHIGLAGLESCDCIVSASMVDSRNTGSVPRVDEIR